MFNDSNGKFWVVIPSIDLSRRSCICSEPPQRTNIVEYKWEINSNMTNIINIVDAVKCVWRLIYGQILPLLIFMYFLLEYKLEQITVDSVLFHTWLIFWPRVDTQNCLLSIWIMLHFFMYIFNWSLQLAPFCSKNLFIMKSVFFLFLYNVM